MTDDKKSDPSKTAPKKEKKAAAPEKTAAPGTRSGEDDDIRSITERLSKEMSAQSSHVRRAEKRAFVSATLSTVMLLIIIAGITYIFLGPRFFDDVKKTKDEQVAMLQEKYAAMEQKQQELAAKQQEIGQHVNRFMQGDLFEKISQIQNLNSQVQMLSGRMQALQETGTGQKILDDGATDLQSMILGMRGRMDTLESELEAAKQDNDALADMLEGLTGQELKAAAMMLAVSQLRTTLMQGGSYEQDLATVRMLAGDDAELLAAIDKIEPYARQGILTRDSLKTEFKGLAGDIVMAKMRGEDVSVKDRFMDRLSNVVSVRKSGMAEGEDTDAIVARAETLLDNGDVQGALTELKKLDNEPRQAAQPFIEQAEARLMADQLSSIMSQNLIGSLSSMNFSPSSLGSSIGGDASSMGNSIGNGVKSIIDDVTGGGSLQPVNPVGSE